MSWPWWLLWSCQRISSPESSEWTGKMQRLSWSQLHAVPVLGQLGKLGWSVAAIDCYSRCRGWEASGTWTWSHGGKSRILPLLGLPGSRFRLGSGSRIPWSRLKVWLWPNSDAQVLRLAWRRWFGWLFREFWNGFDHLIIRSRGPRSECRTWDLGFFFQTLGGSMIPWSFQTTSIAWSQGQFMSLCLAQAGGLTGQTVACFHKVWWASC